MRSAGLLNMGQVKAKLSANENLASWDQEAAPLEDQAHTQRENVYQTFKWTPRATRQVLMWAVIVPGSIAAIAYRYDVSLIHPTAACLAPCRMSYLLPSTDP